MELLALLDSLSIYRREIIRTLDTSRLDLSINITQERVLMAILKMPELNMKELSAQIGLEKSSLTRVIDSLIEGGFVVRTYDMHDRRKINCSLTVKGMVEANMVEQLMIEHVNTCFSGLSAEEKNVLIQNLSCAVETLSKFVK